MGEPWTTMGNGGGSFPLTRASFLARAKGDDPRTCREAVAILHCSYWKPLYAFLRRQGRRNEDAKDLVQDFCASLIEKDVLTRYEPSKGRFRTWLLTCLRRFVGDRDDRDRAQKRGRGKPALSLSAGEDGEAVQVADKGPSPEEAYDRAWALAHLDRAFARWKADLAAKGKAEWLPLVEMLQERYGDLPPVADLARRLSVSEARVRHFLSRDAKRRLREEIHAEIRLGTASEEEACEEVRYLLGCLQPSGKG